MSATLPSRKFYVVHFIQLCDPPGLQLPKGLLRTLVEALFSELVCDPPGLQLLKGLLRTLVEALFSESVYDTLLFVTARLYPEVADPEGPIIVFRCEQGGFDSGESNQT